MPPNPFIELAAHPITTLAWLGYTLLMTGIILAAVPWAIRQQATLITRYQANKHGDRWWSFGDRSAGYIPPAGWLGWQFVTLLVLAVAAWALGTIVWVIT